MRLAVVSDSITIRSGSRAGIVIVIGATSVVRCGDLDRDRRFLCFFLCRCRECPSLCLVRSGDREREWLREEREVLLRGVGDLSGGDWHPPELPLWVASFVGGSPAGIMVTGGAGTAIGAGAVLGTGAVAVGGFTNEATNSRNCVISSLIWSIGAS